MWVLEDAERVFDEMSNRDMVSWNSIWFHGTRLLSVFCKAMNLKMHYFCLDRWRKGKEKHHYLEFDDHMFGSRRKSKEGVRNFSLNASFGRR